MCIVICRINCCFKADEAHVVAKLLKATTTSKIVSKYANNDWEIIYTLQLFKLLTLKLMN